MTRGVCWLLMLGVFFCAGCFTPPAPINLALVPLSTETDDFEAQLAAQGLAALLLAQLRAIPEASVTVDARGCDGEGAHSHSLILRNQETSVSALIELELIDCRSGKQSHETLIQPRELRRDWSSEAAWWVAQQLNAPIALRSRGHAVSAPVMADYLGAVARLQRRTSADIGAALNTLGSLCARQPSFASAQAQLASAHILAYEYGLETKSIAIPAAQKAIAAALKEDPDLGLAHAAMGLVLMNQSAYLEAATLLARAVALDPGDANSRLWLGNALLYAGRPNEATQWFDAALKLEPGLSSALTSRGEAACYGGDEPRCQAFLGQQEDLEMGDFVRQLLRAHRGEFSAVRDSIQADPAEVNAAWTLELRAEACAALNDDACRAEALEEMQQRFASDPDALRARRRMQAWPLAQAEAPQGSAQLDLWQLGLGLDERMRHAASDVAMQTQLQRVLADARDAGLRIPALRIAESCLASFSGDNEAIAAAQNELRAQGYVNHELWRRWRCVAEE